MAAAEPALPTGAPSYWEAAKAHLRSVDPVVGGYIDRHEEPPLMGKGRLFETLVHSIVGQQISARAADAIWGRVKALVGTFDPDRFDAVSDDALRGAGLSGRKVEYVRGVVGAAPELDATAWATMTDQRVRDTLCALRGIGPWTADMLLIFCFLRPDVLPLGDVGVVRVMERAFGDGGPLTPERMALIGDRWRPYRSVATWYLWRSLDPEPVEY